MKRPPIALALALALAMAMAAPGCTQAPSVDGDVAAPAERAHADAHAGADAHDDHAEAITHASGADFPVPDGHVPWTPDAPLMEGMSQVRNALEGLEARAQPDGTTVAARAGDIDAAIEYMFANCQLPPEPDIALHAILARLMAGTQALHADPADTSPLADMHAAVLNYEQLFDDPGAH